MICFHCEHVVATSESLLLTCLVDLRYPASKFQLTRKKDITAPLHWSPWSITAWHLAFESARNSKCPEVPFQEPRKGVKRLRIPIKRENLQNQMKNISLVDLVPTFIGPHHRHRKNFLGLLFSGPKCARHENVRCINQDHVHLCLAQNGKDRTLFR